MSKMVIYTVSGFIHVHPNGVGQLSGPFLKVFDRDDPSKFSFYPLQNIERITELKDNEDIPGIEQYVRKGTDIDERNRFTYARK